MGATGLAAMVSGFNAGWHFGFAWFYQARNTEDLVLPDLSRTSAWHWAEFQAWRRWGERWSREASWRMQTYGNTRARRSRLPPEAVSLLAQLF